MPCVPDGYSYGGVDRPEFPWENWAGTVGRQLAHWYSPASLTDLVDVVRRATMNGVELHALGSGWAFEDVAICADWGVSLGALNRQLSYVTDAALTDARRAAQADSQGRDRLFHVEAGITIGALNQMLADAGLAMPTLGGANGQTLAGASSTSTHGGAGKRPAIWHRRRNRPGTAVGGAVGSAARPRRRHRAAGSLPGGHDDLSGPVDMLDPAPVARDPP